MGNIVKRSGAVEAFRSDKIKRSMENAGITEQTARQVAMSIPFVEGITTSMVRNRVIAGIKNREPQAAKQYESHPRKQHNT